MQLSKRSNIKNRIVTTIMILLAALVMATPVLANSSSWYFLAFYDKTTVNGKANGVFHTMTAGQLTISGTLKTTAIYGTALTPKGWYFEAWKVGLIDSKKCTIGPIAPPVSLNQTISFSNVCGTIPAGKYYLIIKRVAPDNREVQGNGTLKTP